MNWIKLKIRKEGATTPSKGYSDDAGLDLYCLRSKIIWPFCTADMDTGFDIKVPDGHWGTIKSRSSTFKLRRLVVFEGVIDPGYTGMLSVLVWNPTFIPKIVRSGDRLGQLLIHKHIECVTTIVNNMPQTSRGTKGFGSTE